MNKWDDMKNVESGKGIVSIESFKRFPMKLLCLSRYNAPKSVTHNVQEASSSPNISLVDVYQCNAVEEQHPVKRGLKCNVQSLQQEIGIVSYGAMPSKRGSKYENN